MPITGDYRILSENLTTVSAIHDLEKKVRKHLLEGWKIVGGPFQIERDENHSISPSINQAVAWSKTEAE